MWDVVVHNLIPAFKRQGQRQVGFYEFKASSGYTVKPCIKNYHPPQKKEGGGGGEEKKVVQKLSVGLERGLSS